MIASVGLPGGSLPGAVFGFGVGLFLDLALVQTLGLSSLVYVAIGYGAGRLRELRDPQGALVPIVVGAAATAVATIGYSMMQFLLGVDAPVELPARARDPRDDPAQRADLAAPSTRSCAAGCCPRCPRTRAAAGAAPTRPAACRRSPAHERLRAEAAPAARRPLTPQLALRVAMLGVLAFALFAIVFFRLWYLQVLSGDQYLRQALDNRVRKLAVQAPRGAIVDRNGEPLVTNRVATVVQLDPERLPAPSATPPRRGASR